MSNLVCWPKKLPENLQGLYDSVARALVISDRLEVDDVAEWNESAKEWDKAILVPGSELVDHEALSAVGEMLRGTDDAPQRSVVFVVGDAFLGTDAEELKLATQSATAITTARSIAVRRGERHRANVVCVPESMFGSTSSQRGPLNQATELVDVANVVEFLLGDDATYINGQLLFANSGRHLFSSMSA